MDYEPKPRMRTWARPQLVFLAPTSEADKGTSFGGPEGQKTPFAACNKPSTRDKYMQYRSQS